MVDIVRQNSAVVSSVRSCICAEIMAGLKRCCCSVAIDSKLLTDLADWDL